MKSMKGLRSDHGDDPRKSHKLDPIRKSGKERHALFRSIDQDEDGESETLRFQKRESALDYIDDDEE